LVAGLAFFAAAALSAAIFAAAEAAALSFDVEAVTAFFSAAICAGVFETFGFEVNLSISNFVPAPRAAPVNAFTTLLVAEFDEVVLDVSVCFGAPVVFVVNEGFVVEVALFVSEGFEVVDVPVVMDGFDVVPVLVVNDGLDAVPVPDVIEPAPPVVTVGVLPALLMTLLSGARLSAFA
jgi:hypothetical protein